MNHKGTILFIIGLIMFLSGIYLSTKRVQFGTILAVTGGGIMGSSAYFLLN